MPRRHGPVTSVERPGPGVVALEISWRLTDKLRQAYENSLVPS
jgi:hypothetical protein